MIVIFEGIKSVPNVPHEHMNKSNSIRLMKYCYTMSTSEGDIIYNHLTGKTLLVPSESLSEFIKTNYSLLNWFSVPVDFNEEIYFQNGPFSERLMNEEKIDKSNIDALIKTLYSAYLREEKIRAKRDTLYTKEQIDFWIRKYGSPLYVFRKDDFIEAFSRIQNTFQSEYPKYHIAYSYKTNYTPEICKTVKELGGFAEVVSDFELEIARKAGYRDNQIIYNGPCKGDYLEQFLINGGLLNVDNVDELIRILDIAQKHPEVVIEFGVRLNFDIGQDYASRFGIDATDESLNEIIEIVSNVANLKLVGLHFHLGELNINSWKLRAYQMIRVIDKYFPHGLKYVDIGSGMHERNFYDKSLPNINDIRSLENYAVAAIRPFFDYFENIPNDHKPLLITEPGTLLVKDCIDFIATVKTIKCNQDETYVVTDGSKFNLGTESYFDHRPILIASSVSSTKEKIDDASIVGYTCMESDKLFIGFNGQLGVSDYIVFGDVGAYSSVEKPPFIMPNCAMICVDKYGEKLIKRAESYEYLLETYVFS